MAVKKLTLYLLCGPASASKSALVDSVKDEFGVDVISIEDVNARRGYGVGDPRIDGVVLAESVEVVLFEIITAAMSGQSVAINDIAGEQSILDRYIAYATGAGMKIEILET